MAKYDVCGRLRAADPLIPWPYISVLGEVRARGERGEGLGRSGEVAFVY